MSRREPEAGRTCLGCREVRPRAELVRIVRAPDGTACFDVEGRLPGRGAWICPSPACLDRLTAGALGHVLHAPVALPAAAERRRALADALGRRVAGLITVARRMRGVTPGAAGVRVLLAAGKARLVVIAADLDPDAATAWSARAGAVATLTGPDAAAFGELLGRGPLEVAAVTVDGLAAALRAALERWRAFTTVSCDNEGSGKKKNRVSARGSAAAGGG